MTRRVGSTCHHDRTAAAAGEPIGAARSTSASAWRRSGLRGRLAALMVGATLLAVGCGEDSNDAPGGSAPPSSTGASGADGSAPGPGSPVSGPSAENADEGHPSVPAATAEGTAGG